MRVSDHALQRKMPVGNLVVHGRLGLQPAEKTLLAAIRTKDLSAQDATSTFLGRFPTSDVSARQPTSAKPYVLCHRARICRMA